MAQGTGINYNPITGEQQQYTYYYQPQQAPDPMAEQQKLIDQAYRDLPLEQAEQAAMAAMVYQGRRGYARDLENGLSAPEALSKWAPLMFARNLGPGAAMVRANPTQQKLEFTPVPGVDGAQVARMGNEFRVVNSRPKAQPAAVKEVVRNGKMMLEITQPNGFITYRDIDEKDQTISPNTALNTVVDPLKWPFAQQQFGSDATNLVNIAKSGMGIKPQPSVPAAAQAQQPPPVKEVERKTKDGKVAVFDANTKSFLRWK